MRHRVVRSLLQHYLSRGGYDGPFTVTLSVSRYDLIRRRRKYAAEEKADDRDYASTLLGRPPLTYFNVAKHRTIAAIAQTARHEAAHIIANTVEHNADFKRAFRALRFEG